MNWVEEFNKIVGKTTEFSITCFRYLVQQKGVINCLEHILKYDYDTLCHSIRVFNYAIRIGELVYGIKNTTELNNLSYSALLHDIGKTSIDINILHKKGSLNTNEMSIMQTHVLFGCAILVYRGFETPVLKIVLQHHERLEGGGYPFGFTGKDICKSAKIVAVADVFDAITSKRSYNHALSREEGLSFIKTIPGLSVEIIQILEKVVTGKDYNKSGLVSIST